MLSRKIIASHIRNLTDARYFAAWMVDFMSFDISVDSESFIGPDNIKEIIDWLEGPVILGDFTGHTDIEFILETMEGLQLKGIIADDLDLLFSLNGKCEYRFLKSDVIQNVDDKSIIILATRYVAESYSKEGHQTFVTDFHLTMTDLHVDCGLSLKGGEEIKTGLKTFDELDEIYELLLDE